jgi:hypothetical protein
MNAVSLNAIQAAVREYRKQVDGHQPTNEHDSRVNPLKNLNAAQAGEELAERVQMALRGTDWRRV